MQVSSSRSITASPLPINVVAGQAVTASPSKRFKMTSRRNKATTIGSMSQCALDKHSTPLSSRSQFHGAGLSNLDIS